MLILGLLGMYFDAAVVFVTSQTLLFRLALVILWNTFLTCSWRFLISNKLEQLEFKLEKKMDLETCWKSCRKVTSNKIKNAT